MFDKVAQEILDHVSSSLSEPPMFQIVNPGPEPAVDCEMLYVGYMGAESNYTNKCASILEVVYNVGTFREVCVGEDGQPSAADLTLDGKYMGNDAWEIFRALNCWMPSHPGVASARIGALTPLDPLGKFAGMYWTYTIRVSV